MQTVRNNKGDLKMRMHLKNLIDKLLTLPDKKQAINEAIEQEQDPTAKNDLIKIKNKYIERKI